MKQHKDVVKALLTLPRWRQMMRNAQPIKDTEAYDTPMRKLIRYMPDVAMWMMEQKLTRSIGEQGKTVFKKFYDYEFYLDAYTVKRWSTAGVHSTENAFSDDEKTCKERCIRRGCGSLCCCDICCRTKSNDENDHKFAYTNDSYTLVRNNPLFIAGEQTQCPDLVQHPYNIFLRDQSYYLFGLWILLFSFILYAFFLGVWTAIVLSGKHPEYFYAKVGKNLTLDIGTCAAVSLNLTAAKDPEVLKPSVYLSTKTGLYVLFFIFIAKNIVLLLTLFPKLFRSPEYYLEIAALVLSFVYIHDWYDWQDPVILRCPIQYQIGAMGLLLSWINLLTYIRYVPWFNIGIFVAMLQLIFYKFIRFIPVLLVVICGFGFTYWMLLQNQSTFETPLDALMRTGLLTFELNYEEHLYNPDNQYYYDLIFFIEILAAIMFAVFILNLLISKTFIEKKTNLCLFSSMV
jgi:hypothetical protein